MLPIPVDRKALSWAYGVTTCKQRIDDGLLSKTLESLRAAGFDSPRLFIDGTAPYDLRAEGLAITERVPPLRTFGNWWQSAWELYLRNPHADRFAIFQDDMLAVGGLRKYLERVEYPRAGYLNLYTFPENERDGKAGFYQSNQRGRGAVALVFDNETLRTLLAARHMIDRPRSRNPKRPAHKFVDGAIVSALNQSGVREYVHSPSLVQHTGEASSMGNTKHPRAATFPGEDFDATTLIPARGRVRIGIVGYHAPGGLGELNRQMAEYADVDRWMIKPHASRLTSALHPDVESTICPNGRKVDRWLRCVDSVVFAETPYYGNLLGEAKRLRRRTVCVPMLEWLPGGLRGWPMSVDLFLRPTQQCYEAISHVVPTELFPWPVDTDRFKFRPRSTVERFLYIHAGGGFKDRKGGGVVREVLKQWPEIPLTIVSSRPGDWPELPNLKVIGSIRANAELYELGDVLLCPHSCDGLGLEPFESMASGAPVVTTDGAPWNEIPALARCPATVRKRTVRRPVDWYTPDAAELSEILRGLVGSDISGDSVTVRQWAESRSWNVHADRFNELVRG